MSSESQLLTIIENQQKLIEKLTQSENCKKIVPKANTVLFKYDESKFLNYLSGHGLSKNSINIYITTMKLYFRIYDEITPENIRAYQEYLKKNFAPKTVNIRTTAIRNLLISENITYIELPSIKTQTLSFCDNVFNENQYKVFCEFAKTNNPTAYKIARIVGLTGVRASELIDLKTVDLERGYIDIVSKAHKMRRVYFPEDLINDIKPLCKAKYLIARDDGEKITKRGVDYIIKITGRKAGLPKEILHAHAFRHYFAKQFLKHSDDLTLLGDLLGHASLSTTAIYTRKTADEQKKSIQEIVSW